MQPEKQYYSVVEAVLCCVLFWPATSTKFGKSACWTYEEIRDATAFRWLPVLYFEDWGVVPTKRASLVRMFVDNKHQVPQQWPKSNILQTGPAEPLLKYTAKQVLFQVERGLCQEVVQGGVGL